MKVLRSVISYIDMVFSCLNIQHGVIHQTGKYDKLMDLLRAGIR